MHTHCSTCAGSIWMSWKQRRPLSRLCTLAPGRYSMRSAEDWCLQHEPRTILALQARCMPFAAMRRVLYAGSAQPTPLKASPTQDAASTSACCGPHGPASLILRCRRSAHPSRCGCPSGSPVQCLAVGPRGPHPAHAAPAPHPRHHQCAALRPRRGRLRGVPAALLPGGGVALPEGGPGCLFSCWAGLQVWQQRQNLGIWAEPDAS